MSTAVAIQNETFCWFCKSNYNRAIREMRGRSQRHSQDLLQICLPPDPLNQLCNKKNAAIVEEESKKKWYKDELTPGALVLAFIDGEGANADLIWQEHRCVMDLLSAQHRECLAALLASREQHFFQLPPLSWGALTDPAISSVCVSPRPGREQKVFHAFPLLQRHSYFASLCLFLTAWTEKGSFYVLCCKCDILVHTHIWRALGSSSWPWQCSLATVADRGFPYALWCYPFNPWTFSFPFFLFSPSG